MYSLLTETTFSFWPSKGKNKKITLMLWPVYEKYKFKKIKQSLRNIYQKFNKIKKTFFSLVFIKK